MKEKVLILVDYYSCRIIRRLEDLKEFVIVSYEGSSVENCIIYVLSKQEIDDFYKEEKYTKGIKMKAESYSLHEIQNKFEKLLWHPLWRMPDRETHWEK